MKRMIAVFLALALCICVTPTVFASESATSPANPDFTATSSIANINEDSKTIYCTDEVSQLCDSILSNIPDLSYEQAWAIANELVSKAEIVNSNVTLVDTAYVAKSDSETVVSLGRLVDGKLVSDTASTLDTTIGSITYLSESWLVEPHLARTAYGIDYTTSWFSADSYNSPAGATVTCTAMLEAEINVGYKNTNNISATVAKTYGLDVEASATISANIEVGTTLKAIGWRKVSQRPYVYYATAYYEGTQQYYVYDSIQCEFYYITYERTATNTYSIDAGIKTWSADNTAKDPNAVTPFPPTTWEW